MTTKRPAVPTLPLRGCGVADKLQQHNVFERTEETRPDGGFRLRCTECLALFWVTPAHTPKEPTA